MAYEKELRVAISAARNAGALLLRHVNAKYSRRLKGVRDVVTDVDLASQALIARELSRHFPSDGFLGEESPDGERGKIFSGRAWIADPLDGTLNYVLGLPWYCTSIALAKDGEPVVGAVYHPVNEELFYASKGKGAFLNGRRIRTSAKPLEELALGISVSHKMENTVRIAKHLPHIQEVSLRIRSLGSIAEEACSVACGRFGAYYNLYSSPWDFSAAKIIVEEAGGVASDVAGRPWKLDSKDILVANSARSQRKLVNAIKRAEKEI